MTEETKPENQPASIWPLDPDIDYLNHGSFGACPRPVLEFQTSLREKMERRPVEWFVTEVPKLLDEVRLVLAELLGTGPGNLAFVPNATYGINSVLRSLRLEPGDELVVTDHEYNACANALRFVAESTGAKSVVAHIPFPLASEREAAEAVHCKVGKRTRLVLVDHVTSPTALVLPLERIVPELQAGGVDVLVDGAHAPGMLGIELDKLGAAYYTGNLHKWLCAPKGAAFLHVRPDRQELIQPVAISHGYNAPAGERSRFQQLFDWTGTCDFSAYLSVGKSIQVLGELFAGGLAELTRRNRRLAIEARRLLLDRLGIDPPCPESMLGSMASLPLPDSDGPPPATPLYSDSLQQALREHHGIEVPVIPWPEHPRRLLRISAQAYNTIDQYHHLARALDAELAGRRSSF